MLHKENTFYNARVGLPSESLTGGEERMRSVCTLLGILLKGGYHWISLHLNFLNWYNQYYLGGITWIVSLVAAPKNAIIVMFSLSLISPRFPCLKEIGFWIWVNCLGLAQTRWVNTCWLQETFRKRVETMSVPSIMGRLLSVTLLPMKSLLSWLSLLDFQEAMSAAASPGC